MKTITLTDEMAEQLILCVYSRIGIIETGQPILTARDAAEQKHPEWIKPLHPEQMALIAYLYKVVEELRR